MKSIKFACLILMCATSSLALVLPALGVVSFPKQLINPNDVARRNAQVSEEGSNWQPAFHPADQGVNSVAMSQNTSNTSVGFQPTANQGFVPSQPSYGMPVASNGSMPPGYPAAPIADRSFQESPSLDGLPTDPIAAAFDALPQHKVGTGIWLLLGPVWFAALVVWSLAPSPSKGLKSR